MNGEQYVRSHFVGDDPEAFGHECVEALDNDDKFFWGGAHLAAALAVRFSGYNPDRLGFEVDEDLDDSPDGMHRTIVRNIRASVGSAPRGLSTAFDTVRLKNRPSDAPRHTFLIDLNIKGDRLDELDDKVREQIKYLRGEVLFAQSGIYATAFQQAKETESTANPLYASLRQNRELIRRSLNPLRVGIETVHTRDQHGNKLLSSKSHAAFRGAKIPNWMTQVDGSSPALANMIGFLHELDTWSALNRWVISQNLPYIPVLSPEVFSSPTSVKSEGPNPRSNIMLVGYGVANDSIIPVQAKTSSSFYRKEYADGVAVIYARDIGSVQGASLIEEDSNSRVWQATMVHGRGIVSFLDALRGGNKRAFGLDTMSTNTLNQKIYEQGIKQDVPGLSLAA